MGNWRHRPPRRLYNQNNSHYDYEIPSDCLPDDNVPQWEKRFCYAVGSVPWRKVVSAKYFTSGHTNVLNWDDSAVEETFRSAKKRFWAEMNGLGCDDLSPPPGPDIYIDDIDWDPKVDPELMKELDREYFVPVDDEAEVSNKLLKKFKRMRRWAPDSIDRSQWKANIEEIYRKVDEVNESRVDGVSCQWEVKADPEKQVDENPWEQSNKDSVFRKDTTWDGSGGDNRDSNENPGEGIDSRVNGVSESKQNQDSDENPWERGNRDSIRKKDSLWEQINQVNGWGSDCNKDWGWNRGEWNEDSMNGDNRWAQSSSDNKGWRQWTSYRSESRDFGRGRESWHGNSSRPRSREGYGTQRDFGYHRDSRFRTDENNGGSDRWTANNYRGNNKRRVSFQ